MLRRHIVGLGLVAGDRGDGSFGAVIVFSVALEGNGGAAEVVVWLRMLVVVVVVVVDIHVRFVDDTRRVSPKKHHILAALYCLASRRK